MRPRRRGSRNATAPTRLRAGGRSPARCRLPRRPSWRTTSSTTPALARPPPRKCGACSRRSWPTSRRARRCRASGRIMTKRQALGQHFLRDGAIAHEIVDLVAPTERDLVVEIGPGEGALTGILAGRAGRVVALEIDPTLGGALRARLPTVEVLDADARTWDYTSLAAPAGGRVLIGGNLASRAGKATLHALIRAPPAVPREAPVAH